MPATAKLFLVIGCSAALFAVAFTPAGGAAFIAAWGLFAVAVIKAR